MINKTDYPLLSVRLSIEEQRNNGKIPTFQYSEIVQNIAEAEIHRAKYIASTHELDKKIRVVNMNNQSEIKELENAENIKSN